MRPDGNLDLFKRWELKPVHIQIKIKSLLSFLTSLKDITILNGVYKIHRNKVYGNNSTKTKREYGNDCHKVFTLNVIRRNNIIWRQTILRMYVLKPKSNY